jgi:hypothetical protein
VHVLHCVSSLPGRLTFRAWNFDLSRYSRDGCIDYAKLPLPVAGARRPQPDGVAESKALYEPVG